MQQNVHEFASLVKLLRNYFKDNEIKHYLEIGSASGGNLRFMYENLGFRYVTSLDDGQHTEAIDQKINYFFNHQAHLLFEICFVEHKKILGQFKYICNKENK